MYTVRTQQSAQACHQTITKSGKVSSEGQNPFDALASETIIELSERGHKLIVGIHVKKIRGNSKMRGLLKIIIHQHATQIINFCQAQFHFDCDFHIGQILSHFIS